jgi:PPOX class probable F420-dependent enzyme
MALETYRKNGTPVRTPVGFVQEGDTWLVRTLAHSGKVKRLRANNRVRIAPSTARGEPLGPWVEGTAHIMDDTAGAAQVRALMLTKYGLIWRVLEGVNAITSRLRGQGQARWIGVRIIVGTPGE